MGSEDGRALRDRVDDVDYVGRARINCGSSIRLNKARDGGTSPIYIRDLENPVSVSKFCVLELVYDIRVATLL